MPRDEGEEEGVEERLGTTWITDPNGGRGEDRLMEWRVSMTGAGGFVVEVVGDGRRRVMSCGRLV